MCHDVLKGIGSCVDVICILGDLRLRKTKKKEKEKKERYRPFADGR
jgi:hypothetical protein